MIDPKLIERISVLEKKVNKLETLDRAGNFTQGSILFSNAFGNVTEDNATLFFDDTNNALIVGGDSIGNGIGKVVIRGTSASPSSAGPHFETVASVDAHPLFQILSFSHDNMELTFDGYFDTDSTWKSSDAGSNFQIRKNADRFGLWYDSGVAAGSTVSWNEALRLDVNGDFLIAQDLTVTGVITGGTVTGTNIGSTGAWTPVLKGTGTAGTFTYAIQTGRYHKIGSLVIAHGEIQITAISVAPTGSMRVGGLPFTVLNSNAVGSVAIAMLYQYNTAATTLFVSAETLNNTTDVVFWENADSANSTQATAAGINATFIVNFTAIYTAA